MTSYELSSNPDNMPSTAVAIGQRIFHTAIEMNCLGANSEAVSRLWTAACMARDIMYDCTRSPDLLAREVNYMARVAGLERQVPEEAHPSSVAAISQRIAAICDVINEAWKIAGLSVNEVERPRVHPWKAICRHILLSMRCIPLHLSQALLCRLDHSRSTKQLELIKSGIPAQTMDAVRMIGEERIRLNAKWRQLLAAEDRVIVLGEGVVAAVRNSS